MLVRRRNIIGTYLPSYGGLLHIFWDTYEWGDLYSSFESDSVIIHPRTGHQHAVPLP